MSPWEAATVGLYVVVAVLTLTVLGTLRRLLPILERGEWILAAVPSPGSPGGLPEGSLAPSFEVEELRTRRTIATADLVGQATVILLVDSSCALCEQLLRDLEFNAASTMDCGLLVIGDENTFTGNRTPPPGCYFAIDRGRAVARAFASQATPHAFVLDQGNIVRGSGTPNTWEQLAGLATASLGGGEIETNTAVGAAERN